MFAKLKAIFGFSDSAPIEKAVEQKASPAEPESKGDELEVSSQPVKHSRELTLSFISNLLGARALGTEESHQQEDALRVALDEEMIGLSEASIPKLSKNALALMSDLLDPDVLQSKIVTAIKEDPAIAGKVISVANSPAYVGPGVEIKDLEHALSMLGQQHLREIVLAALVADEFEIESFYFEAFGRALWAHSSEVANNAKALSKRLGGNPNLAYFVGLVHDVGKLIIFKKLIELHAYEDQEPHPEVFSHLLGDYSHALTRRACEVWELPVQWAEPIYQFQTASEIAVKLPEAVALHLANAFAELHALFCEGEITEFELIWQLQQVGASFDEYKQLYPDSELQH